MAAPQTKRQNFDVTPEQESEIAALRDALGVSSAKDAVLRAVRIASILSREARAGKVLVLRDAAGGMERLMIPELENPAPSGWRYLVERPHNWRRSPYIKGRRLPAAVVWHDLIANHQTVDEAAEDWDLPVEAVSEAVAWCEQNRAMLTMEAEEERRFLIGAGVALAHSRG